MRPSPLLPCEELPPESADLRPLWVEPVISLCVDPVGRSSSAATTAATADAMLSCPCAVVGAGGAIGASCSSSFAASSFRVTITWACRSPVASLLRWGLPPREAKGVSLTSAMGLCLGWLCTGEELAACVTRVYCWRGVCMLVCIGKVTLGEGNTPALAVPLARGMQVKG